MSLLSAAEPPGFGYDHQDNPGSRVAYLTFDDGPSDWTPDDGCVKEFDRGCAERSAGQRHDVCGRVWRAWQNAGGVEQVGLPIAEPMLDRDGLISQAFERGVIALHPERAAPCGAVWARPSSSEVRSR
jgi:hypothetical protein